MTMSRRRFFVAAAAEGIAGMSAGAGALFALRERRAGFQWHGSALGGEARIIVHGGDRDAAQAAIAAAVAEIERLEAIFSLHRADSQLARLNRDSALRSPSNDLIMVMRDALAWRGRTEGAFDPTVQPLWQAAARGGDMGNALAAVGLPVAVERSQIELPSGSAVTLNGIAQGHITDRVTEVMTRYGFDDVVIDAGELRLPGRTRRTVGLPAARMAVSVGEVSVATSEPAGLVFDRAGDRHHLFDPRTGRSPHHWRSLSVFAPSAARADALSTAFAVSPVAKVEALAGAIGDVAVIGVEANGRVRKFGDVRRIAS